MKNKYFWISILIAIIIWFTTPFISSYFMKGDLDKMAKSGDLFGSVNALFSAVAFAGIIYTIIMQREELSLQREELSLTRGELTRSANAQEMSQKALDSQFKSMEFNSRLTALKTLHETYITFSKNKSAYKNRREYEIKALEVQEEIRRMTLNFVKV